MGEPKNGPTYMPAGTESTEEVNRKKADAALVAQTLARESLRDDSKASPEAPANAEKTVKQMYEDMETKLKEMYSGTVNQTASSRGYYRSLVFYGSPVHGRLGIFLTEGSNAQHYSDCPPLVLAHHAPLLFLLQEAVVKAKGVYDAQSIVGMTAYAQEDQKDKDTKKALEKVKE